MISPTPTLIPLLNPTMISPTPTLIPLLNPTATLFPTTALYPTTTPDPATANWQTYTDAAFGFSLKYPPEWKLNKQLMETNDVAGSPHVVWFEIVNRANPGRNPIQVTIWINEHNTQSVNQWFQTSQKESQGEMFALPPQQYSINGYEAIRTREASAFETDLTVAPTLNTQKAQYTMNILLDGEGYTEPYSETEPFAQQEITNFHLVLSSFRFPK